MRSIATEVAASMINSRKTKCHIHQVKKEHSRQRQLHKQGRRVLENCRCFHNWGGSAGRGDEAGDLGTGQSGLGFTLHLSTQVLSCGQPGTPKEFWGDHQGRG